MRRAFSQLSAYATMTQGPSSEVAANYAGVFDGGLGFGSKACVVVVDFV